MEISEYDAFLLERIIQETGEHITEEQLKTSFSNLELVKEYCRNTIRFRYDYEHIHKLLQRLVLKTYLLLPRLEHDII